MRAFNIAAPEFHPPPEAIPYINLKMKRCSVRCDMLYALDEIEKIIRCIRMRERIINVDIIVFIRLSNANVKMNILLGAYIR